MTDSTKGFLLLEEFRDRRGLDYEIRRTHSGHIVIIADNPNWRGWGRTLIDAVQAAVGAVEGRVAEVEEAR